MACLLDDYRSKLGINKNPLQIVWLKYLSYVYWPAALHMLRWLFLLPHLKFFFISQVGLLFFVFFHRYKLSVRCVDIK